MNSVGPDYFATMRIPLYQGREFSWSDTNASGLKMTLNQAAAKLLFPGQEALGQQVVEERKADRPTKWLPWSVIPSTEICAPLRHQ